MCALFPQVPLVFPAVVFLFSLTLVIVPLIDNPQIEFLYATLMVLAGLLFYIPIVVFNNRPGFMRAYEFITLMYNTHYVCFSFSK